MNELLTCLSFSAEKHKFQKRKDPEGTPYINHPIGVAKILTSEGNVDDLTVLQAAILHDTIEDTDTTYEEILNLFGKSVADVVLEVTDDKNLSKDERKRLQIVTTPSKSTAAKLVKMADKIYNLRDLNRATPTGWSAQRVHEYFVWSKQVTDGCKGINASLESILNNLYIEKGLEV